MFGVAEPSYIRAVNDQATDIRFQVQSQFTRSLEHIEVTQEVERHAVPNPNHERLRRCNLALRVRKKWQIFGPCANSINPRCYQRTINREHNIFRLTGLVAS